MSCMIYLLEFMTGVPDVNPRYIAGTHETIGETIDSLLTGIIMYVAEGDKRFNPDRLERMFRKGRTSRVGERLTHKVLENLRQVEGGAEEFARIRARFARYEIPGRPGMFCEAPEIARYMADECSGWTGEHADELGYPLPRRHMQIAAVPTYVGLGGRLRGRSG